MISIIDDDEAVREATKGLVRSLGYSAATFASAVEFLSSDRILDTTCLITDLEMPGLNGFELQSRLVDEGHRIPIIFITAYVEERIRRRAEKSGAWGSLASPLMKKVSSLVFIGH
jgi:FixJ family two-component response regulator